MNLISDVLGTFEEHAFSHILAALLLVLLGHAVAKLAHATQRAYERSSTFTISGVWIGMCKLPNYPPDIEAVEVYRFKNQADHVEFSFFNYRPDIAGSRKYKGGGVARGPLFSAYYYVPSRDTVESGVFMVRLENRLKGMYAQYDMSADGKLIVSQDFVLNRLDLPWWPMLRVSFGYPPFKDHKQARTFYDKFVPPPTGKVVLDPSKLDKGAAL